MYFGAEKYSFHSVNQQLYTISFNHFFHKTENISLPALPRYEEQRFKFSLYLEKNAWVQVQSATPVTSFDSLSSIITSGDLNANVFRGRNLSTKNETLFVMA